MRKSKVGKTCYKLWYAEKDEKKNDIGIIVDKSLTVKVVNIKRVQNRIIIIKFVLGEEFINIINAYTSQIKSFLTRKIMQVLCKDCKVMFGESLIIQCRLVVLDVFIRKLKRT